MKIKVGGHSQYLSPARSVVCCGATWGRVSAGSVVLGCAGCGSCYGALGRGARGSERSGPCTAARDCSAPTTGTWPPPSAASPPSAGRRSLSPGSRSPAG